LVACEFSGTVRDAFTALGHDATSCDLLPSEKPGKHYQGDVFEIIGEGWDLMIAHPPCTHLAVSGSRWWKLKEKEQAEALEFVYRSYVSNISIHEKQILGHIGKKNPSAKLKETFKSRKGLYKVSFTTSGEEKGHIRLNT